MKKKPKNPQQQNINKNLNNKNLNSAAINLFNNYLFYIKPLRAGETSVLTALTDCNFVNDSSDALGLSLRFQFFRYGDIFLSI